MNGIIRKTLNYDSFKVLEGGKGIVKSRLEMVKKSIARGHCVNPIIVNEKMEIVDGVYRFEACKQLGLPIQYMVVEVIQAKTPINLNRNWSKDMLDEYKKAR